MKPHSTPRAKPQRKARLMWNYPCGIGIHSGNKAVFCGNGEPRWRKPVPVFVLDASPEAQEAMVEAGADALCVDEYGYEIKLARSLTRETMRRKSCALLTALGLISAPSSPKRGRGK